jgi:hypothetical protein
VNLTIPLQTVYFLLPRTRRHTFSSPDARSSTVHDVYLKTFALPPTASPPPGSPHNSYCFHPSFAASPAHSFSASAQRLLHRHSSTCGCHKHPQLQSRLRKNTLRARPPTIISIRTHTHQRHHRLALPSTFKHIDFAFRAETFVALSTPTIFPTHATVLSFAPCDR